MADKYMVNVDREDGSYSLEVSGTIVLPSGEKRELTLNDVEKLFRTRPLNLKHRDHQSIISEIGERRC